MINFKSITIFFISSTLTISFCFPSFIASCICNLINACFQGGNDSKTFKYSDFISYSPIDGPNLFSDLGEQAFIPQPVKEYPLIKYYEIFEKIK